MNKKLQLAIWLMLIAITTACSPSQPPADAETIQTAEEQSVAPPAEESPVTASVVAPSNSTPGSMVVYACEGGSGVTVTYDKYSALVKLPTGSTTLSRAESISSGGGDAYLGEELSLYRNGNVVQLQVAGKSHTCTESPIGG